MEAASDNLAARVGGVAANSPDEETVLRGSFSIYYDRIPTHHVETSDR